MSIGNLGRTSLIRLSTCCPEIYDTITTAAADPRCPCEFGVSGGGRGKVAQNSYFSAGKSGAKWGESYHNVRIGDKMYSMAVDVWPYSPERKNYIFNDRELHLKLIDHIIMVGRELGYNLISGANFSTIKGGDAPHLQISFKAWSHVAV